MKNIITLLFWYTFLSCSVNKNVQCVENKEFKVKFFSHIRYIEKNISVKQDKNFLNSLIFISKYTHVSFNERMNYAKSYPLGVFYKDKVIWLKWYEDNKCNNIR